MRAQMSLENSMAGEPIEDDSDKEAGLRTAYLQGYMRGQLSRGNSSLESSPLILRRGVLHGSDAAYSDEVSYLQRYVKAQLSREISVSESGSPLTVPCGAFSANEIEQERFHTTATVLESSQAGHSSNFIRRNTHVLPIGRSPTDAVNIDDLEAQHNSSWFSKVKHILRADQEQAEVKLDYCILKVPEHHRQPPEGFTPVGWRFGLHNRENLDTTGSEGVKLSLAVALGLVGPMWDNFCNFVVDDPKSMLQCYGLQEEVTSLSQEGIKYVLALDALFLAIFIDNIFPANEHQLCTDKIWEARTPTNGVFNSRFSNWRNVVHVDMCKDENQIPLVLIHRTVQFLINLASGSSAAELSSGSEDEEHNASDENYWYHNYLEKWMWHAVEEETLAFIMDFSNDYFKNECSKLMQSKHILEAAYKVICGPLNMSRTSDLDSNDFIRIPSATKLLASGIKIKGVAGPLSTMSYTGNCLSLPKIVLYDETVSFVRNMAWYEHHIRGGCMFHDFVYLMIDLIQSPVDLEALIKNDVLCNGIGITAIKKWNALEEGLIVLKSSTEHHNMKANINKRYKLRRYRYWREFITLFCSRPWLVLSAFTIVLVTVATLIQTYVAVIGSNRMKPQFP